MTSTETRAIDQFAPWQRCALWLAGSAAACAAVAWIAFQIRSAGHAPEILFPASVGLALGAALLAVARGSRWQGRRSMLGVTLVGAAVVVLAQEFLAHREHLRNFYEVQNRPNVAALARLAAGELPPPDWRQDFELDIRDRGVWLWSFDALAVVLGAAVLVAWRLRPGAAGEQPAPAVSGPRADDLPADNHPAADRPAADATQTPSEAS